MVCRLLILVFAKTTTKNSNSHWRINFSLIPRATRLRLLRDYLSSEFDRRQGLPLRPGQMCFRITVTRKRRRCLLSQSTRVNPKTSCCDQKSGVFIFQFIARNDETRYVCRNSQVQFGPSESTTPRRGKGPYSCRSRGKGLWEGPMRLGVGEGGKRKKRKKDDSNKEKSDGCVKWWHSTPFRLGPPLSSSSQCHTHVTRFALSL